MNERFGEYDYELVENQRDIKVAYELEDDRGNHFRVVFRNDTVGPKAKPMLGNSYEMTYFAKDRETGEWSVNAMVETNVYRLMRTILGDILGDFLGERPWVSVIRLEGIPKEGEVGQTKRTKLYLRHLGANPMSDFRVEEVSTNRINLVKNKK